MVVDSRVAVYQSRGLYSLEQASGSKRVIDNSKLPCTFFVVASAGPCKLSTACAGVLKALSSRHGYSDSKHLRGKLVCLVRAVSVEYDAAVAQAGYDIVVAGASQYLLLQKVWPLNPPLEFKNVSNGPRKWVTLDNDTISEALKRCGYN